MIAKPYLEWNLECDNFSLIFWKILQIPLVIVLVWHQEIFNVTLILLLSSLDGIYKFPSIFRNKCSQWFQYCQFISDSSGLPHLSISFPVCLITMKLACLKCFRNNSSPWLQCSQILSNPTLLWPSLQVLPKTVQDQATPSSSFCSREPSSSRTSWRL